MINAYINWLKHDHIKPIWLNVNTHTEKHLSEDLGWCALSITTGQHAQFDDPRSQGDMTV